MPHPDFATRLQSYASTLLDPAQPAGVMRAFCESLFNDCVALGGELDDHSTALAYGKALSALEAARCVLDFQRTAVLLRAVDAAIRRRLQGPGPVSVLYAGCGPFATLVLPLLHRYPAERLRVRLLDVHPHSLIQAEALCAAAGVADRLLPSLCADATSVRLPPEPAVDVLIAEVMQRALAHEPQLAAMAHLAAQCRPDAVWIPERISVSAALFDAGREFDPEASRLRIDLGLLLELSQGTLPELIEQLAADRIPCAPLRVPASAPAGLSMMLRTRVEASAGNVLDDYDSWLSYPWVVIALGSIHPGEQFDCHYRLGANPGFELSRSA